jgi:hypothetical protein
VDLVDGVELVDLVDLVGCPTSPSRLRLLEATSGLPGGDAEGGVRRRMSGSSRLRKAYGAAGAMKRTSGSSSLPAVFFLAVRRSGINVAGRPAFGF